MTLGLATSPWE